MHLRERTGLDYYVDQLTRFHEPMEAIVLAAKGKTGETLTASALEAIRSHLPAAREIWTGVTAAQFDPGRGRGMGPDGGPGRHGPSMMPGFGPNRQGQ